MSLLYPRTVCITRPEGKREVGAVGYSGLSPARETVVIEGVSASIQMKSGGAPPQVGLPSGASQRTYWKILIPNGAVEPGLIHTRDVVTDDLQARYQIVAPYLNPLGYTLLAEKLEV